MSFAALEQRLNLAAKARLSNASATWWQGGQDVGTPVAGLRLIFERETEGGFADDTALDARPVASLLAADVPDIARKCVLQIETDSGADPARLYQVLRAEADGIGWVKLSLSEVTP